MEKTKVRIAVMTGQVLYKRKRKTQRLWIQGCGLDDENAIASLRRQFREAEMNIKTVVLDEFLQIFDGEKYPGGSISQPMMPHINKELHKYIEVETKLFI